MAVVHHEIIMWKWAFHKHYSGSRRLAGAQSKILCLRNVYLISNEWISPVVAFWIHKHQQKKALICMHNGLFMLIVESPCQTQHISQQTPTSLAPSCMSDGLTVKATCCLSSKEPYSWAEVLTTSNTSYGRNNPWANQKSIWAHRQNQHAYEIILQKRSMNNSFNQIKWMLVTLSNEQ